MNKEIISVHRSLERRIENLRALNSVWNNEEMDYCIPYLDWNRLEKEYPGKEIKIDNFFYYKNYTDIIIEKVKEKLIELNIYNKCKTCKYESFCSNNQDISSCDKYEMYINIDDIIKNEGDYTNKKRTDVIFIRELYNSFFSKPYSLIISNMIEDRLYPNDGGPEFESGIASCYDPKKESCLAAYEDMFNINIGLIKVYNSDNTLVYRRKFLMQPDNGFILSREYGIKIPLKFTREIAKLIIEHFFDNNQKITFSKEWYDFADVCKYITINDSRYSGCCDIKYNKDNLKQLYSFKLPFNFKYI